MRVIVALIDDTRMLLSGYLLFQVEPQVCTTKAGAEGTCQLPASCIGATIQFLEDNECQLPDGLIGTCCVPVSTDNVINIVDGVAPTQEINFSNEIDVDEVVKSVDGLFLRRNKITFASGVADGVEVDTNFVDDSSPSEFHLR